jgi:hypothetical protein
MLHQDSNMQADAERLYNQLEDHVEEKTIYECSDGAQFESTQAAQLYAAYLHCGEDNALFAALLHHIEEIEGWN